MSNIDSSIRWIDSALMKAELYAPGRFLREIGGGPASDVYFIGGLPGCPGGIVVKRSNLGPGRAERVVQVYQGLIAGRHSSTLRYAELLEGGLVVTLDQWLPGEPATSRDFQAVIDRLIDIHSRSVRFSAPHIYTGLEMELNWGLDQRDSLIHSSARILRTGIMAGLYKEISFRGVLTHGDAKPSNCIVNQAGLFLIDWDKSCSVSPLLDLAFAYYCFLPVFAATGAYPSAPLLDIVPEGASGISLGEVMDFAAAIHFLHDAFRSKESANRMSYYQDEARPRYTTWLDVRSEIT